MLRQSVFPMALVLVWSAIACLAFTHEGTALDEPQATNAAVLTNDDVVKMMQAKIGDAVIIAKMKASRRFDTSADALIRLKQLGVSDAVLEAMAQAGAAGAGTAALAPDPHDPRSPHEPGIYVLSTDREAPRMVQLEPTAYSQVKMGGVLRVPLPLGAAIKSKWKAVVRGGKARLRISEPRPTFYFYLGTGQASRSPSEVRGTWIPGVSGPNQFTLAKFETKGDERELVIGEMTGLSASITMGVPSKDTVEFDFEKFAPGIYKVTPRVSLEPGEYCFFYAGAGPGLAGGGQLFDFGVNAAQ